jgi:hypothetical protein
MLDLYIDSFALGCPSRGAGPAEFETYLDRLLALFGLYEDGCIRPVVAADALRVLSDSQSYPVWAEMPQLNTAQRGDVLRIVFTLLDRSPKIEDRTRIAAVLLHDAQCTPDGHLAGRAPIFVEHYHELVAKIIFGGSRAASGRDVLLTPSSGPFPKDVLCSGTLSDAEAYPPRFIAVPKEYSEPILVCESVNGTIGAFQPADFWIVGSCYEDALQAAVEVRARELDPNAARRSWSVGPSFVGSALARGFATSRTSVDSLLRVCADTVLRVNLRKEHPLRVGPGGNDRQQERDDGAVAVRRDIDHEYHIHFWESPAGIEFACVVNHNEFTIPA